MPTRDSLAQERRAARLAFSLALLFAMPRPGLAVAVPFQYGPDDFRISSQGGTGNNLAGASDPAVAYNPAANEYLVVWTGHDLTTAESAIYAQRIDAASGAEVGTDFQISGSDLNVGYPSVAFNSTSNEYLAVWVANFAVRGQRLNAAGAQVGDDDFEIGASSRFEEIGVAYNPTSNQYLVVWSGGEIIVGQILSSSGVELAPDDFTISESAVADRGKFKPAVAYGAARNEYLVAWES
ncbi:MAG TPA: hypothetical protein VGV61_01635, partial [Thermoanaerobaculia bacterium]|nr:hypothetical protein [Thermoanaerobaculia bacterium]